MLKLARNEACGRPREAGLRTGKVREGRVGRNKEELTPELRQAIQERWDDTMLPVTGGGTRGLAAGLGTPGSCRRVEAGEWLELMLMSIVRRPCFLCRVCHVRGDAAGHQQGAGQAVQPLT